MAAGGFHPKRVLPVVLDIGTSNQALLDDPRFVFFFVLPVVLDIGTRNQALLDATQDALKMSSLFRQVRI